MGDCLAGRRGAYSLSQIPVHGSYVADILPGLLVAGGGGVFVGVTTTANAGVSEDKAALAAGLLNTGQQLGTALGLAILMAANTPTDNPAVEDEPALDVAA